MRRTEVLERLLVAVAIAVAAGPAVAADAPMTVSSASFDDGATIPTLQAASDCGGQDVTPAIAWSGVPPGAKSVVVVMHETDGGDGVGFVHWLLYGIAAERGELRSGDGGRGDVAVVVGRNGDGAATYRGMCPPVGDGQHRYVVTVIATDLPTTALGPGLAHEQVLRSIDGHALATRSIVGRYAR